MQHNSRRNAAWLGLSGSGIIWRPGPGVALTMVNPQRYGFLTGCPWASLDLRLLVSQTDHTPLGQSQYQMEGAQTKHLAH